MKVTITRATFVMGEPAEAGAELELEQRVAKYLISIGKAVAAEPEQDGGVGPLETASAADIVKTSETPEKAPAKKK